MILALIAALFLASCSGYDREEFRMEMGKRYDLKKWPDSVFIDTLDRYFAKEPLKQPAKQKAEITMSMDNKSMSLPSENAKLPEKKAQSAAGSAAAKKSEGSSQSFPEKFFEALNGLAENPGSGEFGKRHKAKEGETLDALLLRVYGPQVKKVPKYLSEDMLKRLNPGADFTSLSEGDMVLLPNLP